MDGLATYDLGGSGRTLVIVHGWTGSSDDFRHVSRALTDVRRILLVDQLGHGSSPRRPSYRVSELTDAVADVLDDIGEPVDLLGHSLGGRTVLPIAIQRPTAVSSLVLMDTWADPPQRSEDDERAAEIFSKPDELAMAELAALPDPPPSPEDLLILAEWGPAWVETHNEANARRDPLSVVHLGRDIYGDKGSLLEAATSISCPTTVLVGEYDKPFLGTSRRMADAIPSAELVTIPGAYHSPQLSHPREWQAAIRRHLQRANS